MKRITHWILGSLFMMAVTQIQAQCRSGDAWNSMWTSCQATNSPNPDRGNSHWLHYDLGYEYHIESLKVWNANQPGLSGQGIKTLVVDYSSDGENWKTWGEFEISQSSERAYYEGESIQPGKSILAKYLLLTAKETWGQDSCVSLHEVRMNLIPHYDLGLSNLWLYPNPASDQVKVSLDLEEEQVLELTLLDLTGKVMYQTRMTGYPGAQVLELSVPSVSGGFYLLRVMGNRENLIGLGKLIINQQP